MRISLRQLLIWVTVVCVGLYAYLDWSRDSILIAQPIEATAQIPVQPKTYNGIVANNENSGRASLENILQITGRLQQNTRLVCAMYQIRNGEAVDRSGFATGRNNQLADQQWRETVEFDLAFAVAEATESNVPRRASETSEIVKENTEPIGREKSVQLGCCGGDWWAGTKKKHIIDFDLTYWQAFEGSLREGQNVIAYVAGDTKFEFYSHQSVDDFAAENDGNFVIVWVGLKKAVE